MPVFSLPASSEKKNLQSAVVDLSASGDFVVVNDVSGHRIKVTSFMIQAGESDLSASVLSFCAGSASVIAGPFLLGDREGMSLATPFPSFLFGTLQGYPLVIRLSGSRQLGGYVTYFSDDTD